MNIVVELLNKYEVNQFWQTFAGILADSFPCYSSKIIDYLLKKAYTATNFYYWITNNLKYVYVAKTEGKITGFIVIDQPYGGVSFCRWLGVKKEFQKKGIGSKLINAWLTLAKMQKCHKAEVASQPVAKIFYEKMGLDLEGERKLSYFGTDQYLFGKILGEPDEEMMVSAY